MNFFVPDTRTEQGIKLLHHLIKTIYDEQFDISYYVKGISWEDTEKMAIFERKEVYNRLLKRKTEEKEAAEDVSRKASQARIVTSSKRPTSPARRR